MPPQHVVRQLSEPEHGSEVPKQADSILQPPAQTEEITRLSWGTSQLNQKALLTLRFVTTSDTLKLIPAAKLIFGRQDTTSSTQPDIDLVPFGALENGVSRQHAALELRHDTLTLNDLGSSNGTYLNGQRLIMNQPRVLRDGDEIKFGKLITYIHFA